MPEPRYRSKLTSVLKAHTMRISRSVELGRKILVELDIHKQLFICAMLLQFFERRVRDRIDRYEQATVTASEASRFDQLRARNDGICRQIKTALELKHEWIEDTINKGRYIAVLIICTMMICELLKQFDSSAVLLPTSCRGGAEYSSLITPVESLLSSVRAFFSVDKLYEKMAMWWSGFADVLHCTVDFITLACTLCVTAIVAKFLPPTVNALMLLAVISSGVPMELLEMWLVNIWYLAVLEVTFRVVQQAMYYQELRDCPSSDHKIEDARPRFYRRHRAWRFIWLTVMITIAIPLGILFTSSERMYYTYRFTDHAIVDFGIRFIRFHRRAQEFHT